MASNARIAPFVQLMSKRGFSALANLRPLGKAAEIESCTLDNKLVIACAESAIPISRVAIIFRAGSRNESYELQGASMMVRLACGLSTQNSSGFIISRNIQQIGGTLSASSDRENIMFSVETTSDKIETALRYLQDVIQPAFKPWEVADNMHRLKVQLGSIPPQVESIELLHKAAFRTGLGNSVYMPEFNIGKLSSQSLLQYVSENFTPSRCAVVSLGVDPNILSGFAQNLELESGQKKSEASKYHGGDVRKDAAGSIAHVAIAGQGGAILNQKEAIACNILQYALGNGSVVKRGRGNGALTKALAAAVDAPISFTTINQSYSDAGLFGFALSAESKHVGKAIETLVKAMKNITISPEDVKRAKSQLKSAVWETFSRDSLIVPEIAAQASIVRQVSSADALISAIDSVTDQDVQEAVKKAASSKLSIGAVGNLANVPYSSDLA